MLKKYKSNIKQLLFTFSDYEIPYNEQLNYLCNIMKVKLETIERVYYSGLVANCKEYENEIADLLIKDVNLRGYKYVKISKL